MKLKIELSGEHLFRTERMEFDDEGFLMNEPSLLPMKNRHQREMCSTDSNSKIQVGETYDKHSLHQ